jgi:phosphate transport system permease protein
MQKTKNMAVNAAASGWMPAESEFSIRLKQRNVRGKVWKRFFYAANLVALVALVALFGNTVIQAFGLVAVEFTIEPATLAEQPLEELGVSDLSLILQENLSGGRLRVIVRDLMSRVPNTEFTKRPLSDVLVGSAYPDNLADSTINDLTDEEVAAIISANLSREQLRNLVVERVVEPRVVSSYNLIDSLTKRAAIEADIAEEFPVANVQFRSWISGDFVTSSISSSATTAGLRTALLGTIWVMLITVVVAFPLGVGAAIYLEEYATGDNFIDRVIETNIRNLAGVPSIIYGMLGLAVFVRVLAFFTSGAIFGVTDSNGRTVMAAGLTMALLILPIIIINSQEAIRAVPSSYREGSFGLGATKWQTIWRAVLPAAFPGILTGMILSMSRAVGETAPLIVVGASTFIGVDPDGPFSKFTVVPIQIYQWTSRPEAEFRNLAAAAIIVLLAVLLLLNGTAIILRQYYRRKLAG